MNTALQILTYASEDMFGNTGEGQATLDAIQELSVPKGIQRQADRLVAYYRSLYDEMVAAGDVDEDGWDLELQGQLEHFAAGDHDEVALVVEDAKVQRLHQWVDEKLEALGIL